MVDFRALSCTSEPDGDEAKERKHSDKSKQIIKFDIKQKI